MLTPEQVATLRTLHEKATPAPWEDMPWLGKLITLSRANGDIVTRFEPGAKDAWDASLVNNMRNLLPNILHHIQQQEAHVAAYRQALGTILELPTGAGIGEHDDCSHCERRDEVAGAVWRSTTAGQPLLDRQRELEEALIEAEAHADWLWAQFRGTGTPEHFWKDQPHASQDGYRFAARNRLIEKGLVKS